MAIDAAPSRTDHEEGPLDHRTGAGSLLLRARACHLPYPLGRPHQHMAKLAFVLGSHVMMNPPTGLQDVAIPLEPALCSTRFLEHRGAWMAMVRVAVRTADFQLARLLIQCLRSEGVPFDHLDPDRPLGEDRIWFGTHEEVALDHAAGHPTPVDPQRVDLAVARARAGHHGHPTDIALLFGVDPGPRPGVAWYADDVFVGGAQLERVDDVARYIGSVCRTVDHASVLVRLGDGAPTIRNRITNILLARSWPVEIVDERRTSAGLNRHAHASAAARIATVQGTLVQERRPVDPAEGEVRELKRRSRIASQGRVTISDGLARSVAVGRLSMEEAIRRQRSR